MAADLPENYNLFGCFSIHQRRSNRLDRSNYLEAEPGQYITVARKAKGTNNWFVGNVNGETPRTSNIKFDFLERNKYRTIYADAKMRIIKQTRKPMLFVK
jgi:hypothetical protein